jgi:hypothetical protein
MGDTRFRSGSRIWATTIARRLRFVKRASLDHGSSCKKALKKAHQNELSLRNCGVGEIVLQLREQPAQAALHMSAFGTKRTFRSRSSMSAFGGKADIADSERHVCFRPKADIDGLI